jgi:putative transposase
LSKDGRQVVERFVQHYNEVRLNSAIGYVAPADKLNGKEKQIFKERDRKLESARQARKERRAEVNARKILASTPPVQAAAPPTSILEVPILGAAT